MPLPQLFPGAPQVDVQQTAFSVDALGRYVCSTWTEATLNGGPPFTTIVVGAGMHGAYCAAKFSGSTRPRACSCSTLVGSLSRSTCRTSPASDSTSPARFRRPAIPACRVSSSGAFRGGATRSSQGWRSVPEASRSSGAAGARVSRPATWRNGRPRRRSTGRALHRCRE